MILGWLKIWENRLKHPYIKKLTLEYTYSKVVKTIWYDSHLPYDKFYKSKTVLIRAITLYNFFTLRLFNYKLIYVIYYNTYWVRRWIHLFVHKNNIYCYSKFNFTKLIEHLSKYSQKKY